MIIDNKKKQMLMEARDINYILPAYIRSYQFHSENQVPEKIVCPMFPSVKVGDKEIPIQYVPPLDAVATEIAEDGASVPEVTPAQETELDKKDDEIKKLKARIEEMKPKQEDTIVPDEPPAVSPAPEDLIRQQEEAAEPAEPPAESPAKGAFKVDTDPAHQPPPDRKPNQPPGGDIGPGQGPSDMHPRGKGDQITTQRDLLEEPEIDEGKEKPFEQSIKRDEKGNPVVEDMSDAPSGQ